MLCRCLLSIFTFLDNQNQGLCYILSCLKHQKRGWKSYYRNHYRMIPLWTMIYFLETLAQVLHFTMFLFFRREKHFDFSHIYNLNTVKVKLISNLINLKHFTSTDSALETTHDQQKSEVRSSCG